MNETGPLSYDRFQSWVAGCEKPPANHTSKRGLKSGPAPSDFGEGSFRDTGTVLVAEQEAGRQLAAALNVQLAIYGLQVVLDRIDAERLQAGYVLV